MNTNTNQLTFKIVPDANVYNSPLRIGDIIIEFKVKPLTVFIVFPSHTVKKEGLFLQIN